MVLRGRDLLTGLPKAVEVRSVEIRDAIAGPVNQIVELVKTCVEETPPELVADIMERGIVLAGGGALLMGLDKRLMAELRMPVYLADDPLTCVARGTGRVAEALHLYQRALAGSQQRRTPARTYGQARGPAPRGCCPRVGATPCGCPEPRGRAGTGACPYRRLRRMGRACGER